jgi:hypothetical protein
MESEVAKQENCRLHLGFLEKGRLDKLLIQEKDTDCRLLFKVHFPGEEVKKWIREGKAKNITTIRDPRDCVRSAYKNREQTFDYALKKIIGNLQAIDEFFVDKTSLLVRYEEMMADPLKQIDRIARYLGIKLADDSVNVIHRQTCPEAWEGTLKKLEEEAATTGVTEIRKLRDNLTLIHHKHIGDQKIGRWKETFTEEQQTLLNNNLDPWIKALGYEV